MFNQSAMHGIDGAQAARQRLREYKKKDLIEVQKFKSNLEDISMSPLKVGKLYDLVSPSNFDIPNSYMIKSKISDKGDKRIKDILKRHWVKMDHPTLFM